jgi:hypothetical protein
VTAKGHCLARPALRRRDDPARRLQGPGAPGATLSPMVHFIQRGDGSQVPDPASAPPRRRRVIIIGAGPTGMTAAFHIGEHSLLLERRELLENRHGHSNSLPLGAARPEPVGAETDHRESQRPHSPPRTGTLFISCSSRGANQQRDHTLIHVTRWQPPALGTSPATLDLDPVRMLAPLLRGEMRMNACVVRIDPCERLLELHDGERFTYDKLLCTQSLASLTPLLIHQLPGRVRHDESLRCWLSAHDIEVADLATQLAMGDVDEFTAGKRMADQINEALTQRFRSTGRGLNARRLFEPRLVPVTSAVSRPVPAAS